MSNNLLKEYAQDAKKYNAILVFKGLPEGSFKALSKLILSMQDTENEESLSAIQIDDEAFERFNVTSVPSMVLSLNSECEPNTTCKSSYDKVDGNISIRNALEKFASSGDARFAANKIIITAGSAR
jgi:type-F conjugative transfer system pilin assembly protein TrbC